MTLIIAKVFSVKDNRQKFITIPKDCNIQPGDYVKIEKIEEDAVKK